MLDQFAFKFFGALQVPRDQFSFVKQVLAVGKEYPHSRNQEINKSNEFTAGKGSFVAL